MPSSSQASAVPITFGIELEVLLQCDRLPKCSQPAWDWDRAQCGPLSIAQRLAERTDLPVATPCHCGQWDTCESCEKVPHRNRFRGSLTVHSRLAKSLRSELDTEDLEQVTYRYFYVQQECLALEEQWNDHWEGPPQTGCEIVSPIFQHAEISRGLPAMRQVLQALRGAPGLPKITDECGLHIHVGTPMLSLLASQRIVTLVALLEQGVILHMVKRSRLRAEFYCPIYKFGKWKHEIGAITNELRHNVPDHVYNGSYDSVQQLFRRVWEQKTLRDLEPLTRSGNKTSLYLCTRPRGKADPTKTTFEFRYPGMTADLELIKLWTTFATRCVELGFTDLATYRQTLKNVVAATNEKTMDVRIAKTFQALGLSDSVPLCLRKARELKAGHDPSTDSQGFIV